MLKQDDANCKSTPKIEDFDVFFRKSFAIVCTLYIHSLTDRQTDRQTNRLKFPLAPPFLTRPLF